MTTTKVIIELKINGNPDVAWAAVDAALDDGGIQDAVHNYESDDGEAEIVSAISRADVVHVGFVIDQVHGATYWSRAFNSEERAREWADKTAKKKSGRARKGEAPKFVGRVESYAVEA